MGTDTIAAIATAMTSSGIGIVRISGDEAVSITDRIFEMKNQKKLEDMPTHTIHYGHIHDGDEVLDEYDHSEFYALAYLLTFSDSSFQKYGL